MGNPSTGSTILTVWIPVLAGIVLALLIWYVFRRWNLRGREKNKTAPEKEETGATQSFRSIHANPEYFFPQGLDEKIALIEVQMDMLIRELSDDHNRVTGLISVPRLELLREKAEGLAVLLERISKDQISLLAEKSIGIDGLPNGNAQSDRFIRADHRPLKDEPRNTDKTVISPRELMNDLKNGSAGNEDITEILGLISMDTGKNLDVKALGGKDHLFVSNCLNLVLENISMENLNAGFLAKGLNISRSLVYLKIESITGLTVNEFIRNIRLLRARNLLEEDRLRITEIAYAVGFKSQSYFTQSFKRKYGISPKEYVTQFRN